MQPTYLPWAGYFGLMAAVDVFVSLDDVQFERRSWQSRNRILLHGKDHMLTVPVRKVARETPIHLIEINPEQDWRTHHLQVLTHAYGRHPYGPSVLDLIGEVFAAGHTRLADLNIALIKALAGHIGLSAAIVRASELGCGGQRSDHLAEICRAVGSVSYLSPGGSKDYMTEDQFEERHGIDVSFQHFEPTPYDQPGAAEFTSHLSIVDIIAHKGPKFAHDYISPEIRR
jgi:hypothetical protein